MPTITVSEVTFAKVKAQAEPLVDDADAVVSRVFDFYAAHKGGPRNGNGNGHGSAEATALIRLPVGTHDLTHTRLLSATINSTELHRADWNSLARDMHVMARKQVGSFEALRKVTSANLRSGRFEENGYRYLPEAEFSIQGADANNSCESAFRLAKAMNIPLRVVFEWREREDAAHPGRTGVIEWSPDKA